MLLLLLQSFHLVVQHWQHVVRVRNQDALLRITESISLGLDAQNS